MRKREEVDLEDFDPAGQYTPGELDAYADQFLREDARSELCRECDERGEVVGTVEVPQEGVLDEEGNQLVVEFAFYTCSNDHVWFAGEGALRGIGGENPILFKEHIDSRKRREIYTEVGTPDPSIVSGIYNRIHKDGRKVNSEEQRKRKGASFYR